MRRLAPWSRRQWQRSRPLKSAAPHPPSASSGDACKELVVQPDFTGSAVEHIRSGSLMEQRPLRDTRNASSSDSRGVGDDPNTKLPTQPASYRHVDFTGSWSFLFIMSAASRAVVLILCRSVSLTQRRSGWPVSESTWHAWVPLHKFVVRQGVVHQ